MNILVLSDSHGNIENMVQAVQETSPAMIFHLGDCWHDGEILHNKFPEIPFCQVPGNCDYRPQEPVEMILDIEGQRMLLCHGHTYQVKTSLLTAGFAAEQEDLDLFLFGHTHRPLVDKRGKTLFLNPGSIGDPVHPFYGILTIENHRLDGHTVPLDRV